MIRFNPRFKAGPGSGQPGSVGPAIPPSSLESLIAGSQGGWGSLLLNANNTKIDDALRYLATPYSDPSVRPGIDKAVMDALTLNGQDLQQALQIREGLRKGTTRAFLDPQGQVRSFTQGQEGWGSAADPSWLAIGADGGNYNPLQEIASKLPSAQGRFTGDMVYDPNLGVRINRGQQAAMAQRQQAPRGRSSGGTQNRASSRQGSFGRTNAYKSFGG